MHQYEENARRELRLWQQKMCRRPSFTSRAAKSLQTKINGIIPEQVHALVTGTVKNMVRITLFGWEHTTPPPWKHATLAARERKVNEKLQTYRKAAALSGAGTGAGGILLGLADLPLLMSIKLKFLFDAAALYGYDVTDYRERLYILNIFQLAFSSDERRQEVYCQMLRWDEHVAQLPADLEEFDWMTFQQEYRDSIDLAKMMQLIPGIGAVVGAVANYSLLNKLGETAIQSYRLRWFGSR